MAELVFGIWVGLDCTGVLNKVPSARSLNLDYKCGSGADPCQRLI